MQLEAFQLNLIQKSSFVLTVFEQKVLNKKTLTIPYKVKSIISID